MPEQKAVQGPRRHVVALSYREGNTAPRVVARGYGELAERIIEEAKHHNIYIHDSPELVSLLMQVRLDEQIPETLYHVVAELLAWIIDIDQQG